MIVIAYCTGSGHTARLAREIAAGVASEPVDLIDVEKITAQGWARLDSADAIVFGAPTYMGSVAAAFKSFMDESSDRWSDQNWRDKLAAGFTVATYASGDKLASLSQLSVFAAQHAMVWVGQAEIGPKGSDLTAVNWQGSWLGLMATSSRDKSVLIDEGDLATARRFGARIESAVRRWR